MPFTRQWASIDSNNEYSQNARPHEKDDEKVLCLELPEFRGEPGLCMS